MADLNFVPAKTDSTVIVSQKISESDQKNALNQVSKTLNQNGYHRVEDLTGSRRMRVFEHPDFGRIGISIGVLGIDISKNPQAGQYPERLANVPFPQGKTGEEFNAEFSKNLTDRAKQLVALNVLPAPKQPETPKKELATR